MSAEPSVPTTGVYLPRGLHLGVAALGTVQVTIDGRSKAIRATFMFGAVEAMSR